MVRTDKYGRVVEAYTNDLHVAPKPRLRDENLQGTFNSWREVPGEFDAGHIFADEYGGPAEPLFYTHQRRSVNQSPGAVYNLERRLTNYLGTISPSRVEYSLIVEYSHRPTLSGRRPFSLERIPVRYHMGYRKPGASNWHERRPIENK